MGKAKQENVKEKSVVSFYATTKVELKSEF